MITKLISGGQVGADLSIVPVGKKLKIDIGGTMPKNFRTKYGDKPELKEYGFTEHPTSDSYTIRTNLNVKNSDATLRFAFRPNSPGEVCTYKAIKKYNKPHFDIDLQAYLDGSHLYIIDLVNFFEEHNVAVLNVAGNAGKDVKESKLICNLTKEILIKAISKYNYICSKQEINMIM